jgi:hypothetical protein
MDVGVVITVVKVMLLRNFGPYFIIFMITHVYHFRFSSNS